MTSKTKSNHRPTLYIQSAMCLPYKRNFLGFFDFKQKNQWRKQKRRKRMNCKQWNLLIRKWCMPCVHHRIKWKHPIRGKLSSRMFSKMPNSRWNGIFFKSLETQNSKFRASMVQIRVNWTEHSKFRCYTIIQYNVVSYNITSIQ